MHRRRFFDKLTPYLLVLPVVIFITIFSLLPIAQSLRFAFFDYQLNDQTKNGLFTGERYNLKLHEETVKYVNYYLKTEEGSVTEVQTKTAITALMGQVNAFDKLVKEKIGVTNKSTVEISEDISQLFRDEVQKIETKLTELYAFNDSFTIEEDTLAVSKGFAASFISSNESGLKNMDEVVKDPRVHSTMKFTLIFTAISVFFELILGLALALIMNQAIRGRGLVRTLSLIPWAIPTSVAAMMWGYLYDGSSGVISNLFHQIGLLDNPTHLLTKTNWATFGIILADVWKTTPYMALLLLAGLQTIPDSLYESSSLDGARKWQQFRHITLPLLKPSIFVALLFRTLDAFRVFDLIYVLTGGGPGGSTESISVYAYKVMFSQTRFGYGSAMVLIMALVVGIITFLYIKLLNIRLIGGEEGK